MKNQGDNAELRFMLLNHELGNIVSKPFGDNAKYDLIVDTSTELQRVQVKSTRGWVLMVKDFKPTTSSNVHIAQSVRASDS